MYRVLFDSNNFTSNNVANRGGGIYLECIVPYDCKYNMSGVNLFKNNYANNSGGAIYWSDVQPVLMKNARFMFINNRALIYADDMASYP